MSNIEEMLGQVIAMMAEDKSNDWSDDIYTIETTIEEIKAYHDDKFRRELTKAFLAGWDRHLYASTKSQDLYAPCFNDWYDDTYVK
jgi:hypothetical protein